MARPKTYWCKINGCSVKEIRARGMCRLHYGRWLNPVRFPRRTQKEIASDMAIGSKICKSCKERKPFAEFYPAKDKDPDQRQPRCRACTNEVSHSRARHLKTYGLTMENYDNMLMEQNGCCAICGSEGCVTGKHLSVDHNHVTDKVRGLLCSNCNLGLGIFKDAPELLLKAIVYLEKF